MSSSRDGMNYAPTASATPVVVKPGEFVFAASHFDHGHIYGQIAGLRQAGATLKYIYEPDASRHRDVLKENPGATAVSDFNILLRDPDIRLVTSAAIPHLRCDIGVQVMRAGKDYLTDKAPFTTLEQLARARAAVKDTGRKYAVCYSERLMSESGTFAGQLIEEGAIGRVLQVLNLAPHNLAPHTRPGWFYDKACYGGILTDIGSHQFEQFLTYANAKDATILSARAVNLGHPEYPGLEDFGEAHLITDTGASCYCRLDWFNPAASRTWGDGRTFILGTDGYIEIRKYIDVARGGGDRIFLVNQTVEKEIECTGKVGFPFFSQFILDVLHGTENAMTQEHAFKAAELSLMAQKLADQQK